LSTDERPAWMLYFQLIAYMLALFLLVKFIQFSVDAARRTSHSYVVLYTSARLVREGANVSDFYDDAWFGQQTARFDDLYRDIYRPHSPITALMLLPLSDLDYAKSRVLWTAFNVALLAAASFRLLRELRVRGFVLPIMIALVVVYNPLHVNFAVGQSYVLMLALMVVAWVGYRRGDNRALGIALGLMLALKTAGVFLWVLIALQRRWSALAWALATAGTLAIVSLPFVGIEAWFTYFREVGYFNGQAFLAVTAYQTPTSLFSHLFRYDAQWNTAPIFDAPLLASVLSSASLLGIVGLSIYVGIKGRIFVGARHASPIKQSANDLTFAAFIIASVLIVPIALDYHYTLLLLPILILVAQTCWTWREMLVLALAIALIAVDILYKQDWLSVEWWALLAYPKLYGAVLLWMLALWRSQRSVVRARL